MSGCIRGCTVYGRHIEDCEDESCRGCAVRNATNGLLCERCHVALWDVLSNAPEQVERLDEAIVPGGGSIALTAETTARIGDGWRIDATHPFQGPYARSSTRSGESREPIRLACIAAVQDLRDLLSELVEQVAQAHQAEGPAQLLTGDERVDPRRLSARTYRGEGLGRLAWIDPPARFAVDTACQWLREQVVRVEYQDSIGDDLELLVAAMGQAHALAPWRDVPKRMGPIPCPECHRPALVKVDRRAPLRPGQDPRKARQEEDAVECSTTGCSWSTPVARFALWAHMWLDEQAESA